MNEIVQLKITVARTNPPIWRRILVEKKITFFDLHHIIQIVMGWKNYHLFEFTVNTYRIGYPYEDVEDYTGGKNPLIDSLTVTLDQVIADKGDQFKYEYDFGDGWYHDIVVEDFLTIDQELKYPTCIDGELHCPPEDCGGIGGFYQMLEIIKDKKNPEYKEMKQWLGRQYNPEAFDKERVNKKLSKLEKYIKDWVDNMY